MSTINLDGAAYADVISHVEEGISFQFQYSNSDGDPIDLTSYDGKCSLKRSRESDEPVIDLSFTLIDASHGIAKFSASADDLASVLDSNCSPLYYDMWLIREDGTKDCFQVGIWYFRQLAISNLN